MKKKKSAKRALLLSAVSLLLCLSMFVGTTYAWFTDSVTSANNKIVAGNLDVELYYQAEGENDWTKVDEQSNIFENILWEPGSTQVVKLKIVNEGSLALKYIMGVNIASENGAVNVAGQEFFLSDYIKYGILDGARTFDTREQAIAAVEAEGAATLKTSYNSALAELLPKTDNNTAEDVYTDVVTMVVYMPTTVGNEANYRGTDIPEINLGINVYATQFTSEEDSFGPDYDAGAWDYWDGTISSEKPASLVVDTATKTISINDAEGLAYLDTLLNDGNFDANYGSKWQYTIELNADIDLVNKAWTPIRISNVIGFNGNGHTIKNLNVAVNSDGAGLFGAISCNDLGDIIIENFTVDGATVSGKEYVGTVAGAAVGTFKNITVINATVNGTKYVGGLAGRGSNFINCAVKDSTVTSTGKTIGGLIGYAIYDNSDNTLVGNYIGNVVENVAVIGAYNVGGMLGQAQNVLVEGNTVKNVTVISTKALPADASSNEVRTAALAARSAFAGTTIGSNTVENVACGIEVYGLTLIPNGENSKIIVNDKEGFLNLTKLSNDWTDLFTDGNGNYANGAGVSYYYSNYWTVILEADIDLGNQQISPVLIELATSTGASHFDGKGHTIKNAVIVTDPTAQNGAGLFDNCRCDFKNLKLDNIHVTGSNVGNSTAGILAGDCNFAIDNITITNSSVTGGKYTGGVVGYGYTHITNCTLTNVTVKGGYKLGGVIGYIAQENGKTANVTGNTLTDCTVDGIGGGVFAGGKTEYVAGKVVGNYNGNGDCNNNTVTNMTTTDATENIGKIEAGCTVTQ